MNLLLVVGAWDAIEVVAPLDPQVVEGHLNYHVVVDAFDPNGVEDPMEVIVPLDHPMEAAGPSHYPMEAVGLPELLQVGDS